MWSLECKDQMLTDDARQTTHDGRRTTTDDGQPLTSIAHHEHLSATLSQCDLFQSQGSVWLFHSTLL